MRKIKSCQFNMDTACIDVELENGGKFSLYTVGVEENLNLTPVSSDKLTWLIDYEPETYVKLALDGTLQEYLNTHVSRTSDCEGSIRQSLEKHYTAEIAREIAREMMMYG